MATFYLHIGMNKTGTTAFQSFCDSHRAELEQAGLAYAPLGQANHSVPILALFAQDEAQSGPYDPTWRALRADGGPLADRFGAFLRTSADRGLDALVSGEAIVQLAPEGVARLRETVAAAFDTIVVVALVRPPLAFARSAALQRLKAGRTFRSYVARPPVPDYRARFTHFLSAFGPECVRFGLYDPASFKGGSVATTLFAIMDRPDLGLAEGAIGRANVSMSLTAAKLLSMLNEAVAAGALDRRTPPALAGRLAGPAIASLHGDFSVGVDTPEAGPRLLLDTIAKIPGRRYVLPREIKEAVSHTVAEDAAWLETIAGFKLAPVDERGDDAPPLDHHLSFEPQELTAVCEALDALAARKDDALAKWEQRFAARRKIAAAR